MMEHKKPENLRDVAFYDKRFPWAAANYRLIETRLEECAKYIPKGSVLDLGCGTGHLADILGEQEYHGVDFSPVAIEWARKNTKSPNATFEVGDVSCLPGNIGQYDTVALFEVLEHIEDPHSLAAAAFLYARKRIVVTVPVEIWDDSHVWPVWKEGDVQALFPAETVAVYNFSRNVSPMVSPILIGVLDV